MKPTVAASTKAGVRFNDIITIASQLGSSGVSTTSTGRIQEYKNTRGKVRSIFPQLQWHTTKKKKKKKRIPSVPPKWLKKISELPGITIGHSTAVMDPITKAIHQKVQISLANNIYEGLEDDTTTTPMTYKTSWLLDTAASGNYADKHTTVRDRKTIHEGTGINVGCANKGLMSQTEEGTLPFNNIPEGAEDVQLFENMHSPLLSGGKFVKKGCTLVFGRENAHVVKGKTGEIIKRIITKAEAEDSTDIVMTVPFDERTLTWKTDSDG